MRIITTLFSVGLFLTLSAKGSPTAAYRHQVELGWMKSIHPAVELISNISKEQADDAITLLNKTITLLEDDGGTLTAQQARAVKALNSKGDSQIIGFAEYGSLFLEARWLRREILFQHPTLDFAEILINRTPPTNFSHNGDQQLGRHSRTGPGLTRLSEWKTEPIATSFLADKLPPGATRNPDLHFEGDRVLFAFCNHAWAGVPNVDRRGLPVSRGPSTNNNELERRYFIYEAALDGSWVRQITGTKWDPLTTQDERASVIVEDNDPCYLPDGDIAFISTRSQTYGRCHGGRYNPAWVLHRCNAAGEQIRQLSFGNENEYEPSVITDGRLVFSRWEYTNRHEMLFHMLWQCRPDGTGVANYYGNDTLTPYMVTEQTPIPNSHKVVATAMGHHQYNTGTVIVLDTNQGENGEAPITHITPETPYPEANGWPTTHYSHPYPLTEHLFLVSRADHELPHQGRPVPVAGRAIYLVDDLGGREFIYEDARVASVSPIPIQARPRPPILPSMLAENPAAEGTLFLQNVYLTRNDPANKVQPGMIKALRINALGVQPRAIREVCTPYVNVEIPKKVLGTVPVNPDGSVCFNVPARTPIQLQALDKDGRAILTEKTFFYLQPGEKRSCVGCHEKVGTSPNMQAMAGLLQRGPSRLQPAAGPNYPGGMSFAKTVQPVLDRYCIRCHGLDKTNGKVNLLYQPYSLPNKLEQTAVDGLDYLNEAEQARFVSRLAGYPTSYVELTRRGDFSLGKKAKMWNAHGNISEAFEPFYARGCMVSELLLKSHGKVNMDPDSQLRLIEWMDLNAPLNGDLFPGRHREEDRRFNPTALAALRLEIKNQLGEKWAAQPDCALVNRVFPQESRVLMAPLAEAAGGWGQVPQWSSRESSEFKKMEALVMNSFTRTENENDKGWQPNAKQGAAEPWIAKDRAAYLKMIHTHSSK